MQRCKLKFKCIARTEMLFREIITGAWSLGLLLFRLRPWLSNYGTGIEQFWMHNKYMIKKISDRIKFWSVFCMHMRECLSLSPSYVSFPITPFCLTAGSAWREAVARWTLDRQWFPLLLEAQEAGRSNVCGQRAGRGSNPPINWPFIRNHKNGYWSVNLNVQSKQTVVSACLWRVHCWIHVHLCDRCNQWWHFCAIRWDHVHGPKQ